MIGAVNTASGCKMAHMAKRMTAEEKAEPKSTRWSDDTASGREKPKKDPNHESYSYDWRQRNNLKRGNKKGY